jgi:hypothetical protein
MDKGIKMKTKILFVALTAILLGACGGTATTKGVNVTVTMTEAEYARYQKSKEAEAKTSSKEKPAKATVAKAEPPKEEATDSEKTTDESDEEESAPVPRRHRAGCRGMAPYAPDPRTVFVGGERGGDIAYGLAVRDSSRNSCNGSCIRLYIDEITRHGLIERAVGFSVTLDGEPLPIYVNDRIPQPEADIILADGSTSTCNEYIAPIPADFRTGVRIKMTNASSHEVVVTLYGKGPIKFFPIARYTQEVDMMGQFFPGKDLRRGSVQVLNR